MQTDEQMEGYNQYLDHQSPKSIIQNIPIQQFKQNHIQMIDGKLHKQHEETKGASKEPGSPLTMQAAVRLPNVSLQKSLNRHNPTDDGYASPTNILNQNTTVYDNLKLSNNDDQFIQFEGELFRKAAEGKLKRYWYCLLGKEFYCKLHQQPYSNKVTRRKTTRDTKICTVQLESSLKVIKRSNLKTQRL